MTTIRIREENGVEGANAAVSFDDRGEYPAAVVDPFDEAEERRLEWYFEQHLRFPFTDQVRARQAAESIRPYGERLFEQVFADKGSYAEYASARNAGLDQLRFEIVGSPAFHALHWEALKDPGLPRAFSLYSPLVRRSRKPQTLPGGAAPSPTINLLVVVARPHVERDVGYRTITRPLVEGLRTARLPVDIDVVRPGTYHALKDHLEEKGAGYYHVVHFDLHGGLLKWDDFQKGGESDRLTYRARYGRPDLAKYDGIKAFLFFEDEKKAGRADPAEASEVANLLLAHRIPIVLLNACQSGKQVGASEASLASRLMEAGAQTVVGMRYSVTVSAARLMMPRLYDRLFAGSDLHRAILSARGELDANKQRRAYFQEMIELEDWVLPVVYENRPVALTLQPFTEQQRNAWLAQRQAQHQPPQPAYGFFGRDVDILRIEKKLLRDGNILLVHGMGGTGKTTLLHDLAAWWQTTGFIDRVFYFGYDEKAWTRQQIMHEVAGKLFDPARFHGSFMARSEELQQQDLAEELAGTRHLIILDNLESVTGSPLAIQNTLADDEQSKLKSFLRELRGGRTLVLLGSRGLEDWLAADTFGHNIHELPGLDPEAASDLAERILERHEATKWRTDQAFLDLLKLLDGYPLPLEVVLPNLVRQSPAEVLAALQSGGEGVDFASKSKTESILRCIEYSHGNLSPEAQGLLSCLAPFSGVFNTMWIGQYSDRLRKQPALRDLPFDRWTEVIQEAMNWGLLSPDPEVSALLRLQPIFPYFLLNGLNEPQRADERAAIKVAFRELYELAGGALGAMLNSKEPDERQVGQIVVSLEYPNLLAALKFALRQQVSVLAIFSLLSDYLDRSKDPERGLEVGELVRAGLEAYPADKLRGLLGAEFVGAIDNLASCYLQLRRYEELAGAYMKALELVTGQTELPDELRAKGSAGIYHQLGRVAQEQRQWPEAEAYYKKALEIYIEFKDRYSQASTYHQLGIVAQEQRQWPEAEAYYKKALEIYVEFKDRYSQASTYHQLGIVAQEQRQWAEAEAYYKKALEINVEFKDRYSQASTYHQLGIVAQEQRQWAEAEAYYKKALEIYVEFKDRHSQASTYHQLGMRGPGAAAVGGGRGLLQKGAGDQSRVQGPLLAGRDLPPAGPGGAGAAAVGGGA